MIATLWIAAGASLGAWTRWGLAAMFNQMLPTLPLGTLLANLVGSFLMGILLAFGQQEQWLSPQAQLALGTGFLGGLTTLSTFSAEIIGLMQVEAYAWISLGIAAHVGGSILMTLIGLACGRAVLT